MLFNALERGVKIEELSRAFKVNAGLIDNDNKHPLLSELVTDREDHTISVMESGEALMKKFPVLVDIANEPGFSEQCEITHQRVDKFFQTLDQIEDFNALPLSLVKNQLSKTSDTPDDDEGCNACGGGDGACWDMVKTTACMGLSYLAGRGRGLLLGTWLCACQFCPEDLPDWAC